MYFPCTLLTLLLTLTLTSAHPTSPLLPRFDLTRFDVRCTTAPSSPPTTDLLAVITNLRAGPAQLVQTKCTNMYNPDCKYRGTCTPIATAGEARLELCASAYAPLTIEQAVGAAETLRGKCEQGGRVEGELAFQWGIVKVVKSSSPNW